MVHLNNDGTLTGFATCPKCKTKKPLTEFYKKKSNKHGYKHSCKSCEKLYMHKYNRDNSEKLAKKHSVYVENNKESVNAKRRDRYLRKNDQIRKQHNEYKRNLMSDINNRIYLNALKYIGRYKKTELTPRVLLNCNKKEYIAYLASLFQDGMTMENYGIGDNKWCIDHIIPINNFSMGNIDSEKSCFNHKNTKPMWYTENSSKRHKSEEEYDRYKSGKKCH